MATLEDELATAIRDLVAEYDVDWAHEGTHNDEFCLKLYAIFARFRLLGVTEAYMLGDWNVSYPAVMSWAAAKQMEQADVGT
jgi:hypothetical protein